MNLKKLFSFFTLALSVLAVSAQGVDFMPEGSLLKDALAKAKAENKNVFLDCYTTWCGPCRMMTTTVFPQKEMGDYINPKFVSIKIDMEKGEGPELARKHDVSAYPTFIIFNADGKEIGRVVGGAQPDKFISLIEEQLSNTSLAQMDERFAKGDRDPKFLESYIDALEKAYRKNQQAVVVDALLESCPNTFVNDTLLNLFMTKLNNPFNSAFINAVKNPAALKAAVGERKYNEKIDHVFTQAANKTLSRNENGGIDLNEQELTKICNHAKSLGLNPEKFRINTMLTYTQRNKDWNGFISSIKDYIALPGVNVTDYRIGGWAKMISTNVADENVRKAMKEILDGRINDIKSGKREVQKTPKDPEGKESMKQLELVSEELAKAAQK